MVSFHVRINAAKYCVIALNMPNDYSIKVKKSFGLKKIDPSSNVFDGITHTDTGQS